MDSAVDSNLRLTLLHHAGSAIRGWLTAVSPAESRAIFVVLLVGLLLWVLRLPRERVCPPGDEPAGWSSNLKLWAALALAIQIVIYLTF
ncbi:MAG: hypothetical protein KDM63_06180 [Verrucomicrobiae bacterium]|nr:hypothetical protein [Verrucomicrobiae bacterium]MCB1091563.1 hypothetical protein [Verrucomicrobiae bacterium]